MGLPTYDPRDLDVDGPDLSRRRIAYFSMEIALSRELPTYSGGLGMLAGDTLRSAADMAAPMVAVSLVHRRGYFRQNLDAVGQQTESPVPWSPETTLPSARQVVSISMQGRKVAVCAWRYDVKGDAGYVIPVFLLDTDLEGNDPYDRRLTDTLYGGDTYYRLCQETVLGLGGVALLRALGAKPEVYHMNEGHAALLGIGLLEERLGAASLDQATKDDVAAIAQRCVFTTHTPVPAGHDQFGIDQMYTVLGAERGRAIERFGYLHNALLNMTYLALHFSRYVNGVSMQHGKVSQEMFSDCRVPVHSITNGVHAATWISKPLQALLDAEVPEWRRDNQYFRSIYGVSLTKIANCHARSKQRLLDEVARRTDKQFNPNVLTLGFARRVATYKRASLLFSDPKRLAKIAKKIGGIQILFAGKAHPADAAGKGLDPRCLHRGRQPQGGEREYALPGELRLGAGRAAHPGRRPVGQHAAPPLRGLRDLRNEGRAQRRAQPQRARWMVDRGMRREPHRVGHRTGRHRGGRGGQPLRQAGEPDRAALPEAQRMGAHAAALHRHQWHLLQHPPHVGAVLLRTRTSRRSRPRRRPRSGSIFRQPLQKSSAGKDETASPLEETTLA